MEQTFNPREWLDWLTRVRLVMIGLILLVGGVWPEYVPTSHISRYFLPIIILWITIGILQLILVRQLPTVAWLGPLQVSCDVVMITGVVYTTVLQDGNFTVLYLLVIIVASILFSRQGTFITSLFCTSSLALTAALVHVGRLPHTSLAPPSIENVRLWFLTNSFSRWPTWPVCWHSRCAGRAPNLNRKGKSCWSCRISPR